MRDITIFVYITQIYKEYIYLSIYSRYSMLHKLAVFVGYTIKRHLI